MIDLQFKKRLNFSSSQGSLEVDQKILDREFVVLYGKSGAGKTTFLKILSGLSIPDEGRIKVNDAVWFDKEGKINLASQRRNIGFVFQDYALFPNMTVKENIAFAQNKKDEAFLLKIIESCALEGLLNRKPDSLSGGQKQRTAIARAIVRQPSILILDEPLAALDQESRYALQDELARIHKSFQLTTILVSHDIAEITKLADRVIVLHEGKVIEEGDPYTVFTKGKVSGKVKVVGELIQIKKEDIVYVLTVASGNSLIKVIATEDDILNLEVGDKIMVSSKAFNPIIVKV